MALSNMDYIEAGFIKIVKILEAEYLTSGLQNLSPNYIFLQNFFRGASVYPSLCAELKMFLEKLQANLSTHSYRCMIMFLATNL